MKMDVVSWNGMRFNLLLCLLREKTHRDAGIRLDRT